MKDVGGAVLAGSSPPFPGRERAAVDVVALATGARFPSRINALSLSLSLLIRSVAALVTALATRFTARSPFFIHADLRMFRRLVGATGLGATAPGGRLAAPCCGALASFLVCAECGG